LDSIRKNKHELLAEKHIARSSKSITRVMDQSSDYYLQKYFYEKTIQNLKTNYEKKVDLKKGKARSYIQLTENLDAFYTIEKLRIAIDQRTWQKMYKTEEKIDLGIPLGTIDKYKFSNNPSVKIYKLMYELYQVEESTDNYYSLKAIAMSNIDTFPKDEQREIFDVLVSYCIKWVNKGDMEFHKETLIIYDWGIDKEINLNKGNLSPTSFRNYVVIGLRVGEFDKVEQFIKTNTKILNEERRDNALNFNLARVEFYRGEYEKALSYLNYVNYDDIWYSLNSKSLLLAIYYELEEFDVLENHLDTYQTYLRREKSIQENYRKMHLNFTKYVKKIYRINPINIQHSMKLSEKIKSEKSVINKQWLLEKIDELLPKK